MVFLQITQPDNARNVIQHHGLPLIIYHVSYLLIAEMVKLPTMIRNNAKLATLLHGLPRIIYFVLHLHTIVEKIG